MTSPGLITVRGQHAGQTLIKDIVPGYSCDLTDGKNATTILTELLAYQEVESVILGGVAPELDVIIAVTIPWSTIWDACKEVQKVAGGYLCIDINPDDLLERRLWLANTTGSSTGKQIRLGKNLTGVRHLTDYHDYANRLYPLGSSDLLLSTKHYTRADFAATVTEAGGYKYRFLPIYQAYGGWTGLGGALPAGVTIEKPSGNWENGIGVTTQEHGNGSWYYTDLVIDGNDATYAVFYQWNLNGWTDYLVVEFTPRTTTQLRFKLFGGALNVVDVSADGSSWTNVYYLQTLDNSFTTVTFANQSVKYVRYSAFRTQSYPGADHCFQYEIQLWNSSGLANDNAHWTQGGNERCVRCADADYVAGIGYVISYDHASYLIDLDETGTTRPDVYSAQESFDTSDIDELMARGKIRLGELGEALVSVDVDMIDLSVESGREYEELDVGDLVEVIDEGLGISEAAIVVALEKPDLLHPENVNVEIATKMKDILDLL